MKCVTEIRFELVPLAESVNRHNTDEDQRWIDRSLENVGRSLEMIGRKVWVEGYDRRWVMIDEDPDVLNGKELVNLLNKVEELGAIELSIIVTFNARCTG